MIIVHFILFVSNNGVLIKYHDYDCTPTPVIITEKTGSQGLLIK